MTGLKFAYRMPVLAKIARPTRAASPLAASEEMPITRRVFTIGPQRYQAATPSPVHQIKESGVPPPTAGGQGGCDAEAYESGGDESECVELSAVDQD